MSYTQTLTESHIHHPLPPNADASLKPPFALPIQSLTALHSTVASKSASASSSPALIMNNGVRQQPPGMYGLNNMQHPQPHPPAFAPQTPGGQPLQQPPQFPPNNIGPQFQQRNQAQPQMPLMPNNSPLPSSNPAQVAPPMGALNNPVPNLPTGGVPPMYSVGVGGVGGQLQQQQQQQQQAAMGQNQPPPLAQGSQQQLAARRMMAHQSMGAGPGSQQAMNSMGLGAMGVRRTPSASQGGMAMGGMNMGGMGIPGGPMTGLAGNNLAGGMAMPGMPNMPMTPAQMQNLQNYRRMQQAQGQQQSPQSFPPQGPNAQGPPGGQMPGGQPQPPTGSAPGINASPNRPGPFPNGTGIPGGVPRDMNNMSMSLAQQHMLQNPSMQNQNPSMSQNQPNPNQQILPGQHGQHVGPHMSQSQQQQQHQHQQQQQQHMSNMMHGQLGSGQNPSPMASLNAQSQHGNLAQRPMSGLYPTMNRVPSAPGPSNPPPLGGPGSVMSGLGTPSGHPANSQPPIQPLQPSQHPSSQGMPQQPFSSPLGMPPQHPQQTSQLPNHPHSGQQHPSPSTMGSLHQQGPNPMNMNGAMGMSGMPMGNMGGMSGLGLGIGMPHPPPSASSQQSQSSQSHPASGNGGTIAGMHPPSGTPHPHHASPPRPGTSGGMSTSHPGTPMNVVGSGMRGSPRPSSRSASRLSGMPDGSAGPMGNVNPGAPGMVGMPGPSGAQGMMGMNTPGFPQGGPGHHPGQPQMPFGIARAPSVGGAPFNFQGIPGNNMAMGMQGVGGGRQTPQQQQMPMAGLVSSPGSVSGMAGRGPTPVSAGGRPPAIFSTPADVLRQSGAGAMGGSPYPPHPGNVRPPSRQQHPPVQQHTPHPYSSPIQPPQQVAHHISPPSGVRTGSPALQQMRPSTPGMHPGFGQPPQVPPHPGGQVARPPSRSVMPRGTPRVNQSPLPTTPGRGLPPTGMGMHQQSPSMSGGGPPANARSPAERPASRQQSLQPPPGTPQSHQASPTRTGSMPPSGLPVTGASSQPQQPNRVPPTPGAAGPSGQAQDGQNVPLPMPPTGVAPGYFPLMQPRSLFGIGIVRLMEFSEMLSNKARAHVSRKEWAVRTNDFFTSNGMIKITLWKDNQQNEAKPFEITTRIMPLFFEVTSSSGVLSMSLSIDGARERPMPHQFAVPSIVIDCPEAVWTYRYRTGYIVTLRGPLTALLLPVAPAAGAKGPQFKFENITFESKAHEKCLKLDAILGIRSDATPASRNDTPRIKHEMVGGQQSASPEGEGSGASNSRNDDGPEQVIVINNATIPVEPVNAFGIPQATMRCLELAESVGQMGDLVDFSHNNGYRPREALLAFANKIRDADPARLMHAANHMLPMDMTGMNGMAPSPSVTLYQSSPVQSTMMPHHPGGHGALGHPAHHGTPGDTSSPLISSTIASTPATMTPGQPGPSASSHSTPQLANANLKRKQGPDGSSPANAHEQAPVKRQVKKHKRSVAGS